MLKNGFLGNQASFMLDFVVVALVLVVPLIIFSIYAIKVQRNYRLHKFMQLLLAVVLFAAVAAFEVDLHWVQGGWKNVVAKRDLALSPENLQFVQRTLWIHLVFAISTPFLWAITIGLALRHFPAPPAPAVHSNLHKKLGWLSTLDLVLTSVTGLFFYYFAFVHRY